MHLMEALERISKFRFKHSAVHLQGAPVYMMEKRLIPTVQA